MPLRLLITGAPGIGKSTLVAKLALRIGSQVGSHSLITGFITEEVRDHRGLRIGFDVVSLDGQRGPLARKDAASDAKAAQGAARKVPRVGPYAVMVDEFERLALPLLQAGQTAQLTVVDEIGKMELKSAAFLPLVHRLFDGRGTVLATIPLQRGQGLQEVEALTQQPGAQVVLVTRDNRDRLEEELLPVLLRSIIEA